MALVKASTRTDTNIKGADHGASISLILDESERAGAASASPPLRRDVGGAGSHLSGGRRLDPPERGPAVGVWMTEVYAFVDPNSTIT